MGSVSEKLSTWQTSQGLGKRDGTRKFHREVIAVIRRHWSDCDQPAEAVTDQVLLDFAKKVEHYCPSRWNLIVSILRAVTPRAQLLSFRKLRFRDFAAPSREQFGRLLIELDKIPGSSAGLAVRFLSVTGLRIGEAKKLRWENVLKDAFFISSLVSKNGKTRMIPFLPEASAVLKRLQEERNGSELLLTTPNFRKALAKGCQRAGLPFLSYHCFRHIFTTRCIECGVDLPTVARWLGHQDGGALLARMYFHLVDEHSKAMAAKVSVFGCCDLSNKRTNGR